MSTIVPLPAFRHVDGQAPVALPASLQAAGTPERVLFTVRHPIVGEVGWTFPLLLLDEAQTGLSCREGCHAWPSTTDVRLIGLVVPYCGWVETFWLFKSAVNEFRTAALNAELAALTGGVR